MAPLSPVILIVEDELLLRMDSAEMIEKAGFEVVQAGNANEAIAILQARPAIHVVRAPSSRASADIARITDLVGLTTSSDDAEESKPAPDIFEVVLKKLKIEGADAVAIGDTPYDAAAAGKANIATIGVLCGGFIESSLRQAGCVEIYPGPASLYARFGNSLLAR
jgi:beta-phosphoglucomutase-like phosphatase (HAD superfamily)